MSPTTASTIRPCRPTSSIFISNLKVPDPAGFHSGPQPQRCPAALVSIPELGDLGSSTWAFSETIHSSLLHPYHPQHVVNNPGQVFDDIVTNEQILKRATLHQPLL